MNGSVIPIPTFHDRNISLVEIYGRMENSKFDLLKSNCCIIGFERLVNRVSIVDRGSFFFDIFP